MIYCNYDGCPLTACEKHPNKNPFGVESEAMHEACPHLENWRKRRASMKVNEAFSIFYNINDPEITDEEKGLAIWRIVQMETHNSVTKAAMLKVIKYLLGLCFELPEG